MPNGSFQLPVLPRFGDPTTQLQNFATRDYVDNAILAAATASGYALRGSTNTFTAANTFSANGALSAPAVSFTGTPITGGSPSTTAPQVLIGAGTAGGYSTYGTFFAVNVPAAFSAATVFDSLQDGVSSLRILASGTLRMVNNINWGATVSAPDLILGRFAAANLRLGGADAAAPVQQILSVQSVSSGTTDTAGANNTFDASRGTGTGVGGSQVFRVAPAGSTGSSQNSLVRAMLISPNVGVQFGSGGGGISPAVWPFSASTPQTISLGGSGFTIYTYAVASGETGIALTGTSATTTSGTLIHANVVRSFAPTSGTGVYNHLTLTPTINQTGGANGVTRGIYVNPTLTAAADFRAIEVAAGKTIFATSGALSEPAVSFTGTPITGGTATTTKPMVLVETAGATSTAWQTTGTMLGVNAPTGFTGYLQDWQLNGSPRAYITQGGSVVSVLASFLASATTGQFIIASDTFLSRKAAANWQLGVADSAAPVAQKFSRQSVVAGTSDTAGALFTDVASLGTGNAASGSTGRQTGINGASGTTQQTAGWRDFISGKDTVLTEATATTLFTVTVGTGKYLGMIVECTVFASDGTDFQVLHSTLRINTGNKAGTLGVTGIMQTDCATPYNSSGTLTPVTYTLVDNGSGVLAVKCAATSSLVQTTLSCKYQITAINSSDAITITPA